MEGKKRLPEKLYTGLTAGCIYLFPEFCVSKKQILGNEGHGYRRVFAALCLMLVISAISKNELIRIAESVEQKKKFKKVWKKV